MNTKRLLDLFERVADLPDAVARLRRFVLDLAVRGRLVPQDSRDELASGRFERDAYHDIEVPNGWMCAKIGTLLDFRYGRAVRSDQPVDTASIPVYGSNGVIGFTAVALTTSPSIIVGRKGSAGALNLCNGPSWTTDVAYFIEAPEYFDIQYLLVALRALDLSRLGKGVKPGLSRSDAYEEVINVPPLAEQRRIVAKVDELMALCDRLEATRAKQEQKRDRLARASFARLNTPDPDPKQFANDARFALDNLPALTARPDQVKNLRETILNIAVLGRLVNQDPSDETTPMDLRDGVSESSLLPLVSFPTHWRLAPLSEVAAAIVDCPHSTPKWTTSGKICVRTNQFRPGHLDLTNARFVSGGTYLERIERLQPLADDILYSREGGILGIACRIPPNIELCLGQRMMLIRAGNCISPPFLELVLNSPLITNIAKAKTTGGAAPRVNVATVKSYPIPIPSLDEQSRIVAKVNELMMLCDQLESSQSVAGDTRSRLLDALLADALAPVARELQVAQ